MAVKPKKGLRLSRFIAPLATMMILGYFGFHAFDGQYGIRAHIVMKSKIDVQEAKLKILVDRREILEDRVALLQRGSMERDMIDEQVRRQLNMVREDEIILLYGK
ncbi:septum formation initiator family protein [Pseudahrensia aquimaris]|uniref:Septum formation initiator family protein n=1 Tax=Pseudahrensia aquimaris TaxID=744461 RepID=A0ABW3FHG8_9HYPH